MVTSHVVLVLLWTVYCFLHSLMAANWFKNRVGNYLPSFSKYYRAFYSVFSFITLALLVYYLAGLETLELFELNNLIVVLGIIISFSGLALMIVCIKKYFVRLSGLFQESKNTVLIISGINKYVRHPLYLGTFAFLWGGFLLLPYLSVLLTNAVITVYTLIGIRLEERKLEEEFGDSYVNYRKKVPALWPSFTMKRVRN